MKSKKNKTASYHHGDLHAALLVAAEDELVEKGIESFSLRGVAKRAAVSHAAPAHHFTDVKGLLTALAVVGYNRLVTTQEARQHLADPGPREQLIATGLGYVEFAMDNPALFRLMFSSQKPDQIDENLAIAMQTAMDKLIKETGRIENVDPYTDQKAMMNAMAGWGMVQGLADLLISGRLEFLLRMNAADRERALVDIISRSYRPLGIDNHGEG